MKVYGRCTSCHSAIDYKTDARTRADIALNEGELKFFKCKKCGVTGQLHVDRLKAKVSKNKIPLIAVICSTALITFLYFLYFSGTSYFMLAASFPIMVYYFIRKKEHHKVATFNKLKVKNKTVVTPLKTPLERTSLRS